MLRFLLVAVLIMSLLGAFALGVNALQKKARQGNPVAQAANAVLVTLAALLLVVGAVLDLAYRHWIGIAFGFYALFAFRTATAEWKKTTQRIRERRHPERGLCED